MQRVNSIEYKKILDFYKGKKVLITGNTGFKGSWLTKILLDSGAIVTGYALHPPKTSNLFDIIKTEQYSGFCQVFSEVENLDSLYQTFERAKPEIVFHLAAQPIVRDSYRDPVSTYGTNVMGTVNILECVRTTDCAKSVLNVTTDKVYKNREWEYGYREEDSLGGYDPYSNSKSCSELVTQSYKESFLAERKIGISTARAGNVIGGGDFANDRIIPDSVRAVKAAYDAKMQIADIGVRNPHSIRPYQHVLEPLFMYLTIAERQYKDANFSGCYNIGPDDLDCVTTGTLVDLFCAEWNGIAEGEVLPKVHWKNMMEKDAPHEATFLKLDCSKVKKVFGWQPKWDIDMAVRETVNFSKIWVQGGDVVTEMNREIDEYLK